VSWTALERAWLATLVDAMIPALPAGEGRAAVPAAKADRLRDDLAQLLDGMPGLQRLALRLAVWLVAWLGPLAVGRLPTFRRLAPADRDRVLTRLGTSDLYLVREMVVLLKLVAGLVRELDPGFRRALGWGEGEPICVPGVGEGP
jgi:hypothetical protein